MGRPVVLVLTLVAAAGSFLFFHDFPKEGANQTQIAQARALGTSWPVPSVGTPLKRPGETIHVASFNIQVFGPTKAGKAHVMDTLANIVRQFDVVAVQEVQADDQDVIPRLIDHINAAGRIYDYAISPVVGRTSTKERFAFLFDRSTVAMDRYQLYTVQDPDDLLNWEPFVGWFRAIGPPETEAITFTLVNVHVDPQDTDNELAVLDDVLRAVRKDGRDEDDVILLGDFNANTAQLGPIATASTLVLPASNVATNTEGTAQFDHVGFDRQATVEFTRRTGVFDFMRQFNFAMQEALEVSDHLPVWIELTVYEGGQEGSPGATESL
jgi:endonuclease/exonuclease/phosphatase family metal-dependent hydrolase